MRNRTWLGLCFAMLLPACATTGTPRATTLDASHGKDELVARTAEFEAAWNRRDPQRPQSIWWLTDATHVGFRVVRAREETKALRGLRSKVTRQSP